MFKLLPFYPVQKPELRRQWIEAIGAHNITSKEARVCSLHFKGGRKGEGSRVPTIFPNAPRPSPQKEVAQVGLDIVDDSLL